MGEDLERALGWHVAVICGPVTVTVVLAGEGQELASSKVARLLAVVATAVLADGGDRGLFVPPRRHQLPPPRGIVTWNTREGLTVAEVGPHHLAGVGPVRVGLSGPVAHWGEALLQVAWELYAGERLPTYGEPQVTWSERRVGET